MKLTQAQRDNLTEIVTAKNEPDYQKDAFRQLVSSPLETIVKKRLGDMYSANLIGEINAEIEEKVGAWFKDNCHLLPVVAKVSDFVWTMRVGDNNNNLEFDKFPLILKNLSEGCANLNLFRPSQEVLLNMLKEEASLDVPLPVNADYVGGGMYIVRTQAGFTKAIREHLGAEYVSEVDSYPTSYPALVSLTIGYRGSDFAQVRWVSLNTLKTALYKQNEL